MSASGPSHFADVKNVTYGTVPIYSVTNIRIQRSGTQVKGQDNNKLRFVSSHLVHIEEKVTFDFEDINALEILMASSNQGLQANLAFVWIASANQLNGSALPNQSVTIKNLVFEGINGDPAMKALGKGSFSGTLLGVEDDTDPIVFANAT